MQLRTSPYRPCQILTSHWASVLISGGEAYSQYFKAQKPTVHPESSNCSITWRMREHAWEAKRELTCKHVKGMNRGRQQRRKICVSRSSRCRKQRGEGSMDIYRSINMFSWLRRKCGRVLLGFRLSADGENRSGTESQRVTLKNAALSCMFVHLVSGVSQ